MGLRAWCLGPTLTRLPPVFQGSSGRVQGNNVPTFSTHRTQRESANIEQSLIIASDQVGTSHHLVSWANISDHVEFQRSIRFR